MLEQAADPMLAVVTRLRDAMNEHDLEALVDVFDPDFVSETPADPQRTFRGADQVRRNWEQIFAAIPDITAKVQHSAVNHDEVWSEWEHRGTRRDGSAHVMRGVIIFGVSGGLLAWARFYVEPVQEGGPNVDGAVRRQVAAENAPPVRQV